MKTADFRQLGAVVLGISGAAAVSSRTSPALCRPAREAMEKRVEARAEELDDCVETIDALFRNYYRVEKALLALEKGAAGAAAP